MADRSRLPNKDQIDKLYDMLVGPDEEMDEVSAAAILEQDGVTREQVDRDLRERLEREVKELRDKGADVPPMLLKAIASLQPQEESAEEEDGGEDTAIDAKTWVRDLIAGRPPGDVPGPGQTQHLHAFRGLNMENLSEEDRQILERIDAELEAEDEQEEG
jgi:hypothetical protein